MVKKKRVLSRSAILPHLLHSAATNTWRDRRYIAKQWKGFHMAQSLKITVLQLFLENQECEPDVGAILLFFHLAKNGLVYAPREKYCVQSCIILLNSMERAVATLRIIQFGR